MRHHGFFFVSALYAKRLLHIPSPKIEKDILQNGAGNFQGCLVFKKVWIETSCVCR